MEQKTVQFVVKDNNNFYRLELAKTLLHFVEYDFTYFWERCIEAGTIGKKTGRIPATHISSAKSTLCAIHPYIHALIGDDFSEIVIDCIIEYICRSENLSVDDLWTRCLSPKNSYETAIFSRISKFKTGKAINQWENIIRLQQYALKKLDFIYNDNDTSTALPNEIILARKDYFDMSVQVAANEMGIEDGLLPSVLVGSSSTLPNSSFRLTKVSTAIYRRFADGFAKCPDLSHYKNKDYSASRDKLALDAYDYVFGMSYPAQLDMNFALEVFGANDEEIFMPNGFKAIIDLEFNLLAKRKIVLRKCHKCGRYFVAFNELFYCDRVNKTGLSCFEQYIRENPTALADSSSENEITSTESESVSLSEIERKLEETFPTEKIFVDCSELIQKGQKIYNSLYKRLHKGILPDDFKLWSGYFSAVKKLAKSAEISIKHFELFIEWSDIIYGKTKTIAKKEHISFDKLDFSSNEKLINSINFALEHELQLAKEAKELPKEMLERGQNLYDTLAEKGLNEKELSEWNDYFFNMKKNINLGEAAIDQLADFLDYSDTLCDNVDATFEPENDTKIGEIVDTVIINGKNVDVRKFTPITFESFDDAVKDTALKYPSYADEEEDNENDSDINDFSEENLPQFTESGKLVKEPEWVRMTRAEAYGTKEE